MTEPAEVRTAFAKASHVRVTPMKARRVIDLIRDMPAQQALSGLPPSNVDAIAIP